MSVHSCVLMCVSVCVCTYACVCMPMCVEVCRPAVNLPQCCSADAIYFKKDSLSGPDLTIRVGQLAASTSPAL